MKNPVVQLEKTGCGIASVAALAGVSYTHAKRIANRQGVFAQDSRLWSKTNYVLRLLRQFRIRALRTRIPFVSWSMLPDLALLAIKWHRDGDRAFWHWVVFVREEGRPYVLDSNKSLKRHRRTDFGRMRPKWFIAIKTAEKVSRNH